MPSANELPLTNSQFNSQAATLTIPVLAPQQCDGVTQLLAKIASSLGGGGGTGSSSYIPSSAGSLYTATAPYYINTTTSGTLPANLYSFSVMNAGTGIGSFNNVALPAGASISFSAAPGAKFSPVNYNPSGGTFLIAGSLYS